MKNADGCPILKFENTEYSVVNTITDTFKLHKCSIPLKRSLTVSICIFMFGCTHLKKEKKKRELNFEGKIRKMDVKKRVGEGGG